VNTKKRHTVGRKNRFKNDVIVEAIFNRLLSESVETSPSSRWRRSMDRSLLPSVLPESYVRGVLGIDRGRLLFEGKSSKYVDELVLKEHLIFEGFWDTVKDKVVSAVKELPITKGVESAKKFGENAKGCVVILTQVAADGESGISTVVNGAENLMNKGLQAIQKALNKVSARIKELAKNLKNDKAKSFLEASGTKLESIVTTIVSGVKKLAGGGGWKGMFGVLAAYLAISAVRQKIGNIIEIALDALSGDAKRMLSAAKKAGAAIKDALKDDGDEKEGSGENPPKTEDSSEQEVLNGISILTGAIRGVITGFLKSSIGALGKEAISQIAGPLAWIKKAADIFKEVAEGAEWVSEKLLAVLKRATFKPLGASQPAST